MSTTTPFTAEQLIVLPSGDVRYELVQGYLRMMSPGGWKHGAIAGRIHCLLHEYVAQHDLGLLLAAETGFLLSRDPDTVRAPDVAFIARKKYPDRSPAR